MVRRFESEDSVEECQTRRGWGIASDRWRWVRSRGTWLMRRGLIGSVRQDEEVGRLARRKTGRRRTGLAIIGSIWEERSS